MDQREPLRAGALGDRPGLSTGRVGRVAGAVLHVVGEGGVVDEQVGVLRDCDGPSRGRVSAV